MSILTIVSNLLFLIISTGLVLKPAKRIVNYESICSADYALALIYIFNCIPVLMDLVLGVPHYMSWYDAFQQAIADETTCLIYNSYVIIVMLSLTIYSRHRWFNDKAYRQNGPVFSSEFVLSTWRTPYIDAFIIAIPFIYAVMKGGLSSFTLYGTLIQRGLSTETVSNINQLIMVGLFFCTTRFFVKKRSLFSSILFIFYLFLAIWINGKRYIIVTVLFMVFYLYQMRNIGEKKRMNLKIVLPIVIGFIVMFSAYYILNIKITSTTETLYSNLRIDFGRDDVSKFVIKKVLLANEKILDYPGQTFLSAIFMLVPRAIWPQKPYPHYRYLTAAIFGRTIYTIPSGMTPSIFEMSICNFGWFGIICTCWILIVLCRFIDKSARLENKLLLLVILINVLTQSLDAALSLILVLFVNLLFGKVRFTFGSNKTRVVEHE